MPWASTESVAGVYGPSDCHPGQGWPGRRPSAASRDLWNDLARTAEQGASCG